MNYPIVKHSSVTPVPVAILLLLIAIGVTPAFSADQWTNLNGTSTVTGEMLGIWNGRVLLRLENGKRVSVKKEDLRADSRIQAEARLEELEQQLRQRSEEIKMIADEASAPAPKEILAGESSGASAVPQPPRYVPVPKDSDLRQTLVGIRDQMLAGHIRVMYDTLPASHQKAMDDLFAVMLSKIDAQAFDANRRTMQGIGEVLVTRQRWLFSHPRMALMTDSQQVELLESAAFLRVLFSDEVMSIEAMKSRPLGETLAKLDDILAPYLFASINDPASGVSSMQPDFEVSPGADGKMIAKVVLPIVGPVYTQTFVSAEGRWAWGESATALPQSLKEAALSLAEAPDGSANVPASAQGELAKVDQAVNALMQAQTRQEFHRTLDEILPLVAELVQQWSGYQPPAMQGLAGPMGGGAGYSGEASYEEMMNSGGSEMSSSGSAGMGIAMPGSPGSAGSPGLTPTGSSGYSGSSAGPGMPGSVSPPALELPGQP